MSYDIRIGVKVEGLDVIAVIDEPDHMRHAVIADILLLN